MRPRKQEEENGHFEFLQRRIAQKFGHSLEEDQRGSIANLNEIPDEWIAIARALDSYLLASALLEHLLPQEHWPFINAFLHQVIFGGEDHKTWWKAAVWAPDISLGGKLICSLDQIYKPVGNELRHIIDVDAQSWKQGSYYCGSLASVDPNRTYLATTPEGFANLSLENRLVELRPEQVPIYFRRWIALGIARFLESVGRFRHPIYIPLLETMAREYEWTPDAHKAIAGLNREFQESLIDLETTVPGYAGPDEWYA